MNLTPEIQQAMQSRGLGMPTPALDQTTSASPQGNQMPQQMAAQSAMPPSGAPAGISGAPGNPVTDSETKMIIKALDHRMRTLGKAGM